MTIIKFILVGLAAVMFLALVKKVFSMSSPVGKNEPFVIMSPFEATITKGGKPVANTQVKLNYSWNSGSAEEQEGFDILFTTDANGFVSVPAIEKQIFVSQIQTTTSNYVISVLHNDGAVEIHDVAKSDSAMYGELGVKVEEYKCELTDPFVGIRDTRREKYSLIATRCTWDGFENLKKIEL